MKRRGVLKPWAVILLILGGFALVVGATVLYLVLSHRFDGDKIEPKDLTFSLVDESLANDQQVFFTNNEFYTSTNFQIVLNSATEGVTEKSVVLSLNNAKTAVGNPRNITNGIVEVPKQVMIGRPFWVTLVPSVDGDILGGTTVLTAYADNDLQIPKISANIFVDAPVNKIELSVAVGQKDTSATENTYSVDVGAEFEVDVEFTPQNSKYNFSTSEEKQCFYIYSGSSSHINRNWTTGRFTADNISYGQADKITVYTFANAYYARKILDEARAIRPVVEQGNAGYEDYLRLFNGDVINCMLANDKSYVSEDIYIKVNQISVGKVEFQGSVLQNGLNGYLDQYAKLTVSGSGNTLGAAVKDTDGKALSEQFSNFGIKTPSKNGDALGLKIVGDRVAKVENGKITFEIFDATKEYASDENIQYYILPNTTPVSFDEYFWQFVAGEAGDYNLALAFFYTNPNGERQMFDLNGNVDGQTVPLVFHATDHSNLEIAPVWTDQGKIEMSIFYDDNDNPITDDEILSNDILAFEGSNIYRSGKYFIFSQNGLDLSQYFLCGNPQSYQNLQIGNFNGDFTLYELPSSTLSPLKGFEDGGVYVVYAIIRTKIDGMPYDVDGNKLKYQFVNMTSPREISVESKLSFARMNASFNFGENAEQQVQFTKNEQGKYLITAINRGTDNSQRDVLSFSLSYNSRSTEDSAADIEKLKEELASGRLKIVVVDANGNEISIPATYINQGVETPYISLVLPRNPDGTIADDGNKINGFLRISEAGFGYEEGKTREKEFALRLVYDDGSGRIAFNNKIVGIDYDNDSMDSFVVYYQRPADVKLADDADLQLEGNKIEVEMKIDGTVNISYNGKDGTQQNQTSLDLFNSQLLKFGLLDQYGRAIDSSVYKICLTEQPSNNNHTVLQYNSDSTQLSGFASTQGLIQEDGKVHTILKICVQDYTGKLVPKFDAAGMVSETENFVCASLDFYVTSEGLSLIKYDSSRLLTENGVPLETDFQNSTSLTEVTVEKYIKTGSIIDPSQFIKVYTKGAQDNSGDGQPYDNISIRFNSSMISALQTSGQLSDFLAMITINGNNYSSADDIKDISNIESIQFNGIFNEFNGFEVIRLVVASDNGLFNFNYNINILSSADISPKLQSDYQEIYKNYLDISQGAISVFADNTYSLDTYFPLSYKKDTYSDINWGTSAKIKVFDINGNELEKSPFSIENGNLKIDAVFDYETYRVTIYKDVISSYALQVSFNLYLNPNFVVVEQDVDPFNLNITDRQITDFYKLCKATDYIVNKNNATSIGFSGQNFKLENVTSESTVGAFLQIENNGDITFIADKSISLSFGEMLQQNFVLRYEEQNQDPVVVPLIKILKDGTIQKASDSQNNGISIDVVYGSGVDSIFEGTKPRVMIKGGTSYVVFVQGQTYQVLGSVLISNPESSSLSKSSESLISVKAGLQYLVNSDNNFDIIISAKNGSNTLSISLNVKVIISTIGDIFVNYIEENEAQESGNYNNFDIVMGDQKMLEDNNIFQQIDAGSEVEILHKLENVLFNSQAWKEQKNTSFGVFYSLSESLSGHVEASAEIVSGGEYAEVSGKGGLTVYHLENNIDNAFVVVKVTLAGDNSVQNALREIYFRLKVSPDFEAGHVTYPFYQESTASNIAEAEYLSSESQYYDAKQQVYTINLEEDLTYANSRYQSGKRFTNPQITSAVEEKWAYYYTVESDENVSSAEVKGGKLTVKLFDQNAEATIKVTKSFSYDGKKLVGGDLEYIFKSNLSRVYTTKKVSEKSGEDLTELNKENDIYVATYFSHTADETEITYVADIRYQNGAQTSELRDYYVYFSQDGEDAVESAFVDNGDKGFVYKDENGIHFKIKGSISHADLKYTLHIASDDCEITSIKLTINGPYGVTVRQDNLVGGQNYTILGGAQDNSLVKIKDLDTEDFISSNVVASLEGDNKEKVKGFVKIDIGENNISFAHLQEDIDISLKFEVKGEGAFVYTFVQTFHVVKNITKTSFEYQIKEDQYAGATFTINDDIKQELIAMIENVGKGDVLDTSKYEFVKSFNIKCAQEGSVDSEEVTVKYTFVGEEGTSSTIDFAFTFRYTIKESVTIKVNYPVPDGENEINREVVESGKQFEGFFTGTAELAKGSRISVTNKDGTPDELAHIWTIGIRSCDKGVTVSTQIDETQINQSEFDEKLKGLSDEDVSNLNFTFSLDQPQEKGTVTFSISVNGTTTEYTVVVTKNEIYQVVTTYPNKTNNMEVVYAEDYAKMANKALFAQNRLLKYENLSTAVGTYTLRFEKQGERQNVIYDRIFEFSEQNSPVIIDLGQSLSGYKYVGTSKGSTYNTKLRDEDVYALGGAPKLTSRIAVSYYGLADVLDGVGITLQAKRYQVNNNEEITDIQNDHAGTGKADEFKLSGNDFGSVLKITPTVTYGSRALVTDGGTYDIKLEIKFSVETSNKVVDIYAGERNDFFVTYAPEFGIKYNNTQIAEDTKDILKTEPGRISLDIYGFAETPFIKDITKSEFSSYVEKQKQNLGKNAYNVHTTLINNDQDGIRYYTGLTPRVGNFKLENKPEDNEYYGDRSQGTVFDNYLAKSGILSTGLQSGNEDNTGDEIDYVLEAHGANNDGNHVMLLLTYFVRIGEGTSDSDYVKYMTNLEFRVLPNDNFEFRQSNNGVFEKGENEKIEESDGYYRNIKKNAYLYEVPNNGNFDLFNTTDENGKVVIKGTLYGETRDAAPQFTYYYHVAQEYNGITYNNWYKAQDELRDKNGWNKEGTQSNSLDILSIKMPTLALGEKYFYVEFENTFGYKGRFYYHITSENNPEINESNVKLAPGEEIEFGAYFEDITPTITDQSTSGEGEEDITQTVTLKYQAFSFYGETDATEALLTAANNLKIGLGDTTNTIKSVTLSAKLNANQFAEENYRTDLSKGQTIYKKVNNNFENIIIFEASNNNNDGNYFGDDTWFKDRDQKEQIKGLDLSTLVGADVEVEVELSQIKHGENASFTPKTINLEYNADQKVQKSTQDEKDTYKKDPDESLVLKDFEEQPLKMEYSSYGNQEPTANESNTQSGDKRHLFKFDGIEAYGIKNDVLAVDTESIKSEGKISELKELVVVKVEFWKDNQIIGASDQYEDTAEKRYSPPSENLKLIPTPYELGINDATNLITNDKYFFVENENSIYQGKSAADYFTVPNFDGLSFGDGEIIDDVTMRVYIVSLSSNSAGVNRFIDPSDDGITAVNVDVQIQEKHPENLVSTIIEDGAEVNKQNLSSTSAINDVLEFKLAPHETITYAVYNEEFVNENGNYSVDSDGVPYINKEGGRQRATVRTVSNNTSHFITKYESITRNMADEDLTKQLKQNAPFYLYIVSDVIDENPNKQAPVVKYGINNNISFISSGTTGSGWVSQNATIQLNTPRLYNDTLEFELEPGETITYAVSNEAFVKENGNYSVDDNGVPYITVNNQQQLATVRTVSNESPLYSVKKYESITRNMAEGVLTENLTQDSPFYLYIISDNKNKTPVVKYGSNENIIATDQTTTTDENIKGWASNDNISTIQEYNGEITLNIEHADRISGDGKTEKLYFLYDKVTEVACGNSVYRYSQDVTVKPIYSNAQFVGQSNLENRIIIDNYLVAGKGETADLRYYIIPLKAWAKDIKLTKSIDSGEIYYLGKHSDGEFAGEKPYQFKFEINNDSQGAGSAYVDDFGNIITKQGFNIGTDVVHVNVYMKVSGIDGNFDIDSTSKKLGTYDIGLGTASPDSNIIENSETATYSISGADVNLTLAMQADFSLNATSEIGSISANQLPEEDEGEETGANVTKLPTQTTTIGSEIKLHDIFDYTETVARGKSRWNVSYYVYKIEKDGVLVNANMFDFNRLQAVSFDSIGDYTVYMAVKARDKDDAYQAELFKFSVNVYNDSDKTDKEVAVDITTSAQYDLKGLFDNGGTVDWYEIKGNEFTSLEKGIIDIKEGVEERTLLARTTLGDKVFVVKFYGYNASIADKSSVLVPKGNEFNLYDLLKEGDDRTGIFYKVDGNEIQLLSSGKEGGFGDENKAPEETYLYVTEDQNGNKTIKTIKVTFNIVPAANPTELSLILKEETTAENKKTVSKNDLLARLKEQYSGFKDLNTNTAKIYKIGDNNILEEVTDEILLQDTATDENYFSNQLYLIDACTTTTHKYVRFNLTFITYLEDYNITHQTSAVTVYNLANNLKGKIIEAIGQSIPSTADIKFQQLIDDELQTVVTIDLSYECTLDFLVTLDNKIYYFTITFDVTYD